MTNKNDFTNRLTTAPIYHQTNNNLSGVTLNENKNLSGATLNIDTAQKTDSTWQKWFQQIHNIISVNSYYGNPSCLLNSDFYFNSGVSTPTTEADGNGAFFSEKWQVTGAAGANYSLTQTAVPANDPDQTGSVTYMKFNVTSWDGSTLLYLYQSQAGSQFVRRYQGRNLYMSAKIKNNTQESITIGFRVLVHYDPTSKEFKKGTLTINPGINYISAPIKTDMIDDVAVGGSPYVNFGFQFVNLPSGTADLNVYYIKAELADTPTELYIDHALEETRIANS